MNLNRSFNYYIKPYSWLIGLLILCLLQPLSISGQKKERLEKKKSKIQKEIKLTNQLLRNAQKSKSHSLDELNKLKSKIHSRGKLISIINNELDLIENESLNYIGQVKILEKELSALKEDYAKVIYHLAINNHFSYDLIIFVLSSESFNQAFRRLNYLKQYINYRKKQAKLIEEKSLFLKRKIEKLETIKKEKYSLVLTKEKETQKLKGDQIQTQKVVKKLKSKERQLRSQLRKKQKEKRVLDKTIATIIRKEIEKERRRRKRKKKKTTTKKQSTKKRPSDKKSLAFEEKKGRLQLPVNKGVITGRFGKQKHPVLKYVFIENNGIDISTVKNASVRPIFKGEVSTIAIIPGQGKIVMIRHGEYLSVYSYFKTVNVIKGEKITTNQKIGTILENNEGKSVVHLEIWQGMKKLNPQKWLLDSTK